MSGVAQLVGRISDWSAKPGPSGTRNYIVAYVRQRRRRFGRTEVGRNV